MRVKELIFDLNSNEAGVLDVTSFGQVLLAESLVD
jgi:hypothetical protein